MQAFPEKLSIDHIIEIELEPISYSELLPVNHLVRDECELVNHHIIYLGPTLKTKKVAPNLQTVPFDILQLILNSLSFTDLSRLTSTSRFYQSAIKRYFTEIKRVEPSRLTLSIQEKDADSLFALATKLQELEYKRNKLVTVKTSTMAVIDNFFKVKEEAETRYNISCCSIYLSLLFVSILLSIYIIYSFAFSESANLESARSLSLFLVFFFVVMCQLPRCFFQDSSNLKFVLECFYSEMVVPEAGPYQALAILEESNSLDLEPLRKIIDPVGLTTTQLERALSEKVSTFNTAVSQVEQQGSKLLSFWRREQMKRNLRTNDIKESSESTPLLRRN